MFYSSRMLALVLAISISVITTLLLALFSGLGFSASLIAFGTILAISFGLSYLVLDTLIFEEIRRIHKMVSKLKSKDFRELKKDEAGIPNPLRMINEEIYSYAEVKQKEIEELKKLEQFRKEFIADVSHELKTPIFAAQGFVHTLLDGAVNDGNVRIRFLKKAAKSLDRLDVLVQDLLTLSHLETGQIKMQMEMVDLSELTLEVFEQFENKSDKRDIRLKIESDSNRVTAYCDRDRISQVLSNLISNAIKHSQDGNDVIVKLRSAKKSVHVSVTDFGEGIGEKHIDRIFERFYRVDKSRSREKGGTGLGLAIVKHILEGHNTKAEVSSTPGKGSVFSFKLSRRKIEVDDNE
jgi:two-component system, OmpR family, phosphate regulon sensor histidine kinase PhoR